MAEATPVERIKRESRGLRGTLAESLLDAHTGALREDDQQLLRLHGSYQQDDRDIREDRRQRKLEPLWRFMVRLRLPGGVCTPAQWLAIDDLARQYAGSTLRLTTRQTFQFHGIVKRDLKPTMQAIDAALIDTIATCGDVNRNVIASVNPVESPVHAEVADWARRLSEHLLPRTRAWHEIWLDGEKLVGEPEEEPVYGTTFLPRKFKAAIAVPPDNDVDVFAHDLGFIAIVEGGRLRDSISRSAAAWARRTATGDVPAARRRRRLPAAGAPARGGRGGGHHAARLRRPHEPQARAAQVHHRRPRPRLVRRRGQAARGVPLEPARPFEFTTNGDRFGWQEGFDGRWHLTLRIPSGRIADRDGAPWLTGLRRIAEVHRGDFRITPTRTW
jgi:sulfite reductase (NADPH) hemoprotein beta-component